MLTLIGEYPAGTVFFVQGNVDEFGNFTPTTPPQPISSFGNVTYDPPLNPVYAEPPVPRTVTPQPSEPHGSRIYNVTVKEGVKHFDGDLNLYSVEAVAAAVYGWQQPQNAIGSDDEYATTSGVTGYSAELVLSNLGFQLPAGAEITGLKVTVERSKL